MRSLPLPSVRPSTTMRKCSALFRLLTVHSVSDPSTPFIFSREGGLHFLYLMVKPVLLDYLLIHIHFVRSFLLLKRSVASWQESEKETTVIKVPPHMMLLYKECQTHLQPRYSLVGNYWVSACIYARHQCITIMCNLVQIAEIPHISNRGGRGRAPSLS